MRIHRSVSTAGVALVAVMLVMSTGGGAFGQEASPGASPQPLASSETGASPGTSPAVEGDLCARFRQESNISAGTARPQAIHTQRLAQTDEQSADEHVGQCPAPRWDPTAAWSFGGTVDTTSAFHWSEAADDGSDQQAEILGVGWVRITLARADAAAVIASGQFATAGAPKKAIKAGDYYLFQVETAEQPAFSPTRNLSFHLGTDKANDIGNNVPTTVSDPESPWQHLQNVYSIAFPTAGSQLALFATDFAGKLDANGSPWYNDKKTLFAARLADASSGVQFLIPAKAMGRQFRPVSYSDAPVAGRPSMMAAVARPDIPTKLAPNGSSPGSGYDWVELAYDMGLLSIDEYFNAMLGCFYAELIHSPVVVDVWYSGNWVSICFDVALEERPAIQEWMDRPGVQRDGIATTKVTQTVEEDGVDRDQEFDAQVYLWQGRVYLEWPIGLSKYGHHALKLFFFSMPGGLAVPGVMVRMAGEVPDAVGDFDVDKTAGPYRLEKCRPDGD